MMGCSPGDNECDYYEKPAHQVTIAKGFWMGQTEVTVAAYKRFVRSAGKKMPPERDELGDRPNPGWKNEALPIVNVNWDDACNYCAWAGGRLPTEAEWEYAARGGTSDARYGPLDEIAWYADNSGQLRLDSKSIPSPEKYIQLMKSNGNGTHEVGVKRPNSFGLFDMLGNVRELVNDWFDQNYYRSAPSQYPPGPLRPLSGNGRVVRGGGVYDFPKNVRVSLRSEDYLGIRLDDTGFRCAVGER